LKSNESLFIKTQLPYNKETKTMTDYSLIYKSNSTGQFMHLPSPDKHIHAIAGDSNIIKIHIKYDLRDYSEEFKIQECIVVEKINSVFKSITETDARQAKQVNVTPINLLENINNMCKKRESEQEPSVAKLQSDVDHLKVKFNSMTEAIEALQVKITTMSSSPPAPAVNSLGSMGSNLFSNSNSHQSGSSLFSSPPPPTGLFGQTSEGLFGTQSGSTPTLFGSPSSVGTFMGKIP
jgi:hypothetical protein